MKVFGRLLPVVAALGIVLGGLIGCGATSPTQPTKKMTPEPPKGDTPKGDTPKDDHHKMDKSMATKR